MYSNSEDNCVRGLSQLRGIQYVRNTNKMELVSIGPGPAEAARFDSLVAVRPAFVKFHSPGCGHCRAMAGAWDALRHEPARRDVIVIEVHADAIPHIKSECARPEHVRGYPTLMHVHPGGRKAREYQGDRTTKDLLRFIEEEFKRKGEERRGELRSRREARSRTRAQTAGGRSRRSRARRSRARRSRARRSRATRR